MYVRMYGGREAGREGLMDGCMHAFMTCMYVSAYICTDVCKYIRTDGRRTHGRADGWMSFWDISLYQVYSSYAFDLPFRADIQYRFKCES